MSRRQAQAVPPPLMALTDGRPPPYAPHGTPPPLPVPTSTIPVQVAVICCLDPFGNTYVMADGKWTPSPNYVIRLRSQPLVVDGQPLYEGGQAAEEEEEEDQEPPSTTASYECVIM